ncbi:HupE/UreJ family protein [Rhizobium sp. SIMBA_035]
MSRFAVRSLTTTLALTLPTLAFAHTGVGSTSGFAHGFGHPISGIDHTFAMVLVGLLAYQLGGRALWLVPSAFVTLMAVGGALGISGYGMPMVEAGIATSIIVLGAAVALKIKAPTAAAAGIAGLFALFHGHAHGSEMPADAAGMAYAAGFVVATSLLHVAGLGLGYAIDRVGGSRGIAISRAVGGLAVVAGFGLLAGML